jgi:hypothetical protein
MPAVIPILGGPHLIATAVLVAVLVLLLSPLARRLCGGT